MGGFITSKELNSALNRWIKFVQLSTFSAEINSLSKNKPLLCNNKILSFNPFLDDQGILRVGGRLHHSHIAYESKHPVLLPKRHHLTDLIIRHYHISLLHGGPQLVQACIREKIWIISARDAIRHLIRKCVTCCKTKAAVTNQLMFNLPSSRITPAPAFQRCVVDYGGPFHINGYTLH